MLPHGAGTTLGHAADVISAKPFALVVTMSPTARKMVLDEHGESFATDLVKRHKAASFTIFHDGIGWTWVDRAARVREHRDRRARVVSRQRQARRRAAPAQGRHRAARRDLYRRRQVQGARSTRT
jgi:hypothetical protein